MKKSKTALTAGVPKSSAKGRRPLLPGLRVKEGFTRHPFDVRNHVQTSGLVSGRDLAVGHPHDRHSTAYYGIAPSVLERLCKLWRGSGLAAPPEDYSFIDFGCGMGRALLVAAEMPFREVVGVELHPVLAETAEKNIAAWQAAGRATCPIRVVRQDAVEFDFPANPCVAFLFNPFRAPVLNALMRRMETSFAGRPGKLDLLYANDEFEDVLEKNRRWKRLWKDEIPLSEEDAVADTEILSKQPNDEYAATAEERCSIYRCLGGLPGGLPDKRPSRRTSER